VLPSGDHAVTHMNDNPPNGDQQVLALHCRPTGSSPAGTARLGCGGPTKAADVLVANAPRCDFGGGPEQCIPGAFIRGPVETSQRIAVDQSTGELYLTWYDYRFGEFDIFLSSSSDGGATWTAPQKVNPDSGTDHYFSAIDIAERGSSSQVAIGYYRTGRVPSENQPPPTGFLGDEPGVAQQPSDFVFSTGVKLETPFHVEVLSPEFPPPDGVQAGFNGDYTGLAVGPDNVAHPIWSDTRNAVVEPDFNGATVDEDVFTTARHLKRNQAE
jgi:hypothetical protein